MILILLSICVSVFSITCDPQPGTPSLKPFGIPRGIKPGRVVWSHKKEACTWNGVDKYFWKPSNLNQTDVDQMLSDLISHVSDSSTPKEGWDKIFRFFNEKHGGNGGYLPSEKIAIKINMNVEHSYVDPNNGNSISPQFIVSLFRQLVYFGGVPQENIYVYDAARWVAKEQYYDFFKDEFPNIQYRDNKGGESYVKQVQVDESLFFEFSNKSVLGYNATRLPYVTTNAKYLISVGIVRGHDIAGQTATAKNFFGNIYNPDINCEFGSYNPGHWCPKFLHEYIRVSEVPMGSYSPLVDLLGFDKLGGNGLLYLMDGLYSGTAEHEWLEPIKYEMSPFNGNYMCSGFASLDPVALDSVIFDFLRNEKNQPYTHTGCIDNYLHEAAQADNPPSGTIYKPNGKTQLESLGCHEHWRSVDSKVYSGNLGGSGIELISLE